MADVRAFPGWRYNLARVGELSRVVAPPYDVIGPELQNDLYERHPANVVRIELNREQPDDSESDNRYTRAARFLNEWKSDDTLIQESQPTMYVCHQTFEVEGQQFTRRGFFARLKLEPLGAGSVYAHEETMPGPKADRLRLFHATGMNVSPIFGLFPDAQNEVQEMLEQAVRGQTPLEATDHLGVTSRLWPVRGDELISKVRGLVGPRPVFIADGHHRYETALKYREERAAAGFVRDDDSPANFVLMLCVGMSDPGLVILPTHRLVSGLPGLTSQQLRALLANEFEIDDMGEGVEACRRTWEIVEGANDQRELGLGTVADGRWLRVRLIGGSTMARLVPHHSAAWRELAVSILHELILGELLKRQFAPTESSDQSSRLRYVHLLREVMDGVAAKQCDLACLVPAVNMEHVQQIASTGERMPAKSTYFYPKLLTGLIFNPIA